MAPQVLRRSLCFVDDKEFHSSQALLLKRPIQDCESSNAGSSNSSLSTPSSVKEYNKPLLLSLASNRPIEGIRKENLRRCSRSNETSSSDVTELQDDSFVNFSVGHLSCHNSSVLNMARYARALARADDDYSQDGANRRKKHRKDRRRHNCRRKKDRNDYTHEERFTWLAPVMRCFYY